MKQCQDTSSVYLSTKLTLTNIRVRNKSKTKQMNVSFKSTTGENIEN